MQEAHWLSGRVLDSKKRDRDFEPPSLVLVQPRKTRPFITERLVMGREESNQTRSNKGLPAFALVHIVPYIIYFAWVKVFRIIPEFRILRLTLNILY